MVIVGLMGGLGNQLFQYALGRKIAIKNNDILKLDISPYKDDTLRKYELFNYNIIENIAHRGEIIRLRKGGQINKFLNHFRKVPQFPESLVKERFFHFDPTILDRTGDIYLDGFWQSEKYFKDIRPTILTDFTVKTKPDNKNTEMAKKISDLNSISLHVRRTDYVTNPRTNQRHGTCSMDYYQSAINMLTRKVDQPHFFIFSDDPLWTQENLMIDFPVTFVTNNDTDKAYEDLRLMSLCKHHIIANSTFSWWGAWLCQNKEKIVIAPLKRFNISGRDTKDYIPENWIMI